MGHIGRRVKGAAIGVVNKNKSTFGSFVHCLHLGLYMLDQST